MASGCADKLRVFSRPVTNIGSNYRNRQSILLRAFAGAVGACELESTWPPDDQFSRKVGVITRFHRHVLIRRYAASDADRHLGVRPLVPDCRAGCICRKHGISSATFFKWKSRYGGLDVSDARRLKVPEDENRKLKNLLAEAMLDNAMLKDLNAKKW